jgi:hypothetical protein
MFVFQSTDPEVDEAAMEKADEELRLIIQKLWPYQDMKTINLALPLKEELHSVKKSEFKKMTVGKIYAGLIILENFRAYKQAAKNGGAVVSSCALKKVTRVKKRLLDNLKKAYLKRQLLARLAILLALK